MGIVVPPRLDEDERGPVLVDTLEVRTMRPNEDKEDKQNG